MFLGIGAEEETCLESPAETESSTSRGFGGQRRPERYLGTTTDLCRWRCQVQIVHLRNALLFCHRGWDEKPGRSHGCTTWVFPPSPGAGPEEEIRT
jgi:hypothetical protein